MKLIYKIIAGGISKALFALILISSLMTTSSAQTQENTKIKIISAVFSNCQVKTFKNEKIIATIARNKFAIIPVSNNKCKILELSNGIFALAFNIYLSDDNDDYENMVNAELYNFMDLSEKDPLEHLTKNERLIQVILYDINKNKFIAKANSFPIENLDWLPTGMGDLTQYEGISNFTGINPQKKSFYLKISECPDCNDSYYFFKFVNSELKSSNKQTGCFNDICEEKSQILVSKITNCYEASYEGEEPVIEKISVLSWDSN